MVTQGMVVQPQILSGNQAIVAGQVQPHIVPGSQAFHTAAGTGLFYKLIFDIISDMTKKVRTAETQTLNLKQD